MSPSRLEKGYAGRAFGDGVHSGGRRDTPSREPEAVSRVLFGEWGRKAAGILEGFSLWVVYGAILGCLLPLGMTAGWASVLLQIAAFLAAGALLVSRLMHGLPGIPDSPLAAPLAALVALCLAATALSVQKTVSARAFVLLAAYICLYLIVLYHVRGQTELKRVAVVAASVGVFLGVFGLFKYAGVNPFSWWDYSGFSAEIRGRNFGTSDTRLASTFRNADHFAAFLSMSLPLGLGVAMSLRTRLHRTLLSGGLLLTCGALILTLSRGAWLAALAALCFMIVYLSGGRTAGPNRSLKIAAGALAAACLVGLTSWASVDRFETLYDVGGESSFTSRVQTWKDTAAMIADRPVFGHGPGTYALVFPRYQGPVRGGTFAEAHNEYLQFAAEAGLPVLAVIAWMLVVGGREAMRKRRHPGTWARNLTAGAATGLVAITIHNVADFNLHVPANCVMLVVLAAILTRPTRHRERKPGANQSSGRRLG